MRCPVMINLVASRDTNPTWTGKVYLQRTYTYRGSENPPQKHSSKNSEKTDTTTFCAGQLGPWTLQERAQEFLFAEWTDDRDTPEMDSLAGLEHIIYLAQMATHNPETSHALFRPGASRDPGRAALDEKDDQRRSKVKSEVQFSPNLVRLEVSSLVEPALHSSH